MKVTILSFALMASFALVAGRFVFPAESQPVVTIPLNEIGRCGLSPESVARLIELSPLDFDQSPSGFRGLAFRQCYVDAALIVDLYASTNASKLDASGQRALRWHAAQMYAHAGPSLYRIAIARSMESVDASSPGSWKAYVEATVAFLARDLDRLKTLRNALVAFPDAPKVNVAVIDRLIQCFERPYSVAYSPQSCPL